MRSRRSTMLAALVIGLSVFGGQPSNQDLVVPTGSSGRGWYVAPEGAPSSDGSRTKPMDLATALGRSSPARAGDTIWLTGGVYGGSFVSDLLGTPEAPIVVRRLPGSRVTLDGGAAPERPTLTIRGANTWYWGFEVMNSDPNRIQHRSGNPTMRGTGVDIHGPGVRVINLVVHDAANGIAAWSPAGGAVIYGSLIYFNGIEGTDRGHGHGLYLQNVWPPKRVVDNIIFQGFGAGIHAYTEGGSLDNLQLEGNVLFDNGALSAASAGTQFNLLIGGLQTARYTHLRENFGYLAGQRGGNAELGYRAGCRDAVVEGNYFVGGDAFSVTNCENVRMRGNTFYGNVAHQLTEQFPENVYRPSPPRRTEVFVRPNQYEAGRAHIVVFNWEHLDSVDVTAAAAHLRDGDQYEIRDSQNYFGPPVRMGTFRRFQRLTVPMTGLTTSAPAGEVPLRPQHTAPTFATFVLLTRGS